MNKEELMRIAIECGLGWAADLGGMDGFLEVFASRIAAAEQRKWEEQTMIEINEAVLKEREECAKLCEKSDRYRGEYFAYKIREKNKQWKKY